MRQTIQLAHESGLSGIGLAQGCQTRCQQKGVGFVVFALILRGQE